MRASKLFLTLPVIWMMAGQLEAQQQPLYFQTLNCIKVMPGKGREWTQFARDTSMKVAQMRADAGEILTWTLLGSVMPAGQEARCSHMISTISEGAPRAPMGGVGFEKALQKAGVTMTASDWTAKASSLASLVSTEMWRPRIRVGAPQAAPVENCHGAKRQQATVFQTSPATNASCSLRTNKRLCSKARVA
jgi:hypothetical protein